MSKSTLVRRNTIQAALAPKVFEALSTIDLLDLSRVEDQRRFFRALVHIGAETLLMRGAQPEALLALSVEAISKEVAARENALVVAGIPEDSFLLPVANA
jgi:hypothetical protein